MRIRDGEFERKHRGEQWKWSAASTPFTSVPRRTIVNSRFGSVTHELVPLAAGVYAWLAEEPSHSQTNSGAVIASDGLTVIDAGLTPLSAAPFAETLRQLSPLPVRRLVLTGSHIDLVGGSAAFPLAAVYGSSQTSAHLDQPANPGVWSCLHPDYSSEFAELTTRPVTHTVIKAAHLCPASIAVPISGTQFENLAVQVPGADVVFAGALASFGTVPLGFEADFPAWKAALDEVALYGQIFIPAHGPIGGTEEIDVLGHYLQACIDADGELTRLGDGPWSTWTNQSFHPVNVERAAMLGAGDPSPPPSMLTLLER
ncbi:MAG: glyoxylase-like metal-dependent hydrolase (beta-lactamase superfamily II) [Verrucomicrobiales bacterium]